MTTYFNDLKLRLGDPELTAKFQKICGVKSLAEKSKSVNGNNVISEATNEKAGNGCSMLTHGNSSITATMNGTNADYGNGLNGIKRSNGIPIERKHKNGYHKNVMDTTGHHNTSSENNVRNGNGACHTNGSSHQSNHVINNAHPVKSTYLLHYSIDNKALYWLFSFGASLGNELFYILYYSFFIWNFDSYVIRRIIVVWAVVMYVGQAAKDLIKWPRPKSPPVVPLEDRYELEYGMPSTHAMVGVAIPFTTFFFMLERYEFNIPLGLVIAVSWCLLVSSSRLYLGMHSVLDVFAGFGLSCFLMLLTIPCVQPLDQFLISNTLSLPLIMVVCVALSWIYPPIDKWSTTRGDTILILGVFSGIYAGTWLTAKTISFKPEPENLPHFFSLPTLEDIGIAMVRQIIGVILIFIVLTIVKKMVLHVISWCKGYNPKDPCTKQRFIVELPYKYLSYLLGGLLTTFLMPLVFTELNIMRDSYYSELLSPSS